jgi:hypothetical protein
LLPTIWQETLPSSDASGYSRTVLLGSQCEQKITL